MGKTIYLNSLEVLIAAATELKTFLTTADFDDKNNVLRFTYMNKVLPEIMNFVFDSTEVINIKLKGNFLETCWKERCEANFSDTKSEIANIMEYVVEQYYSDDPTEHTEALDNFHWVLVVNWANDESSGQKILGVYATEAEADAAFIKQRQEEEKAADFNGYTINTDIIGDFDASIPGFYDTDHISLYLKKVKTEERSV